MSHTTVPTAARNTHFGLTNNQLKIIAMLAMLIDHVGLQLLPHVGILRCIGRIAFPIFAYMIAEGCRHTKNRKRYLLSILMLGIVCQAVYSVALGSLYMNVLLTLSASILMIYSIDLLIERKTLLSACPLVLCVIMTLVLCTLLPELLDGTDFAIDYGIFGILLPVMVYYAPTATLKLFACALALLGLVITRGAWQWYAFLSLPLLAIYNGERGKVRMKYAFYIFYPLHLVAVWAIGMVW